MVLLVTGCRSGIGLAVAREGVRRGHVVYGGVRAAGADALRQDGVRPLALDVTDAQQRDAAVATILAEEGRIDALVNNAGVALGGFLEQVDEDELREVFEVNVFGLFSLTRAVVAGMRERGDGVIVNVSSMSGRMAFPGLGAYAASKFALEGMSEAWHHELRLMGVRMHNVEPGAYRTDIWEQNRRICRRGHEVGSPWADAAHRLDALVARSVKRSARDPQEVAVVVLDLVEGRRRGFRNPVGPDAVSRLWLERFTPFGLRARIFGRVLRGTMPGIR